MKSGTTKPGWARATLVGRANAWRRGNITLANLSGSVPVMLRHGMSLDDIVTLLATYGLRWDADARTLQLINDTDRR